MTGVVGAGRGLVLSAFDFSGARGRFRRPAETGVMLHHATATATATPTPNTRIIVTGTTESFRVEDRVRGSG
ncbi:hypothetical protein [Streptomyces sp. SJL17-4]|uniref:hypothetical protein n=1 Tax=Streptomyces sp. SJL17-4 TaxID=2967224 RepID=UPI0030D4314F